MLNLINIVGIYWVTKFSAVFTYLWFLEWWVSNTIKSTYLIPDWSQNISKWQYIFAVDMINILNTWTNNQQYGCKVVLSDSFCSVFTFTILKCIQGITSRTFSRVALQTSSTFITVCWAFCKINCITCNVLMWLRHKGPLEMVRISVNQ